MHVRLETKRVGGCRETLMPALHHWYPNTSPPTLSQLFQHKSALLEMAVMKYVLFHELHKADRGFESFSPSRSAFLRIHSLVSSCPVCLSLFILHPFCFPFGTCRIFINSLARLPLRPVQRGAGGGGGAGSMEGHRDGEIGRGVSTGLNPVLGGRYESSGSMNSHPAKISPSSCLGT